ncbi:hypothetical protein DDF67_10400 [Caulobacter endophyticus]|uniref:Uncharacterized protein n=1 Tax=Caulobacter endophyticus TaxID=2172652 RepID=A0A2T9K2X4_9CAUL|nr:hypothetical protein DDF67_10400 [Caulobacter endophyticus]
MNLFLAWIVTDRFSLTTRQQVIWAGAFLAALAAGQVALLVGWWRGGGARRIRARRGKHEPRGPTR